MFPLPELVNTLPLKYYTKFKQPMTSETGKLSSATIKHIAEWVLAFSSSAINAEFATELPGVAQHHCDISGASGYNKERYLRWRKGTRQGRAHRTYLACWDWWPVNTPVDRLPGSGSQHAGKERVQIPCSKPPAVLLHPLHIGLDEGLPKVAVVHAEWLAQHLGRETRPPEVHGGQGTGGKALYPLAVPYPPFQSQEISLEGYGSNRKNLLIQG